MRHPAPLFLCFFMTPVEHSATVQKMLRQIVEESGIPVIFIYAFGYVYDSAFWIAVATDAERNRLQQDNALNDRLQTVFVASGYQALINQVWDEQQAYLKKPGIVFESQETVDREWSGNWYHAMK